MHNYTTKTRQWQQTPSLSRNELAYCIVVKQKSIAPPAMDRLHSQNFRRAFTPASPPRAMTACSSERFV